MDETQPCCAHCGTWTRQAGSTTRKHSRNSYACWNRASWNTAYCHRRESHEERIPICLRATSKRVNRCQWTLRVKIRHQETPDPSEGPAQQAQHGESNWTWYRGNDYPIGSQSLTYRSMARKIIAIADSDQPKRKPSRNRNMSLRWPKGSATQSDFEATAKRVPRNLLEFERVRRDDAEDCEQNEQNHVEKKDEGTCDKTHNSRMSSPQNQDAQNISSVADVQNPLSAWTSCN